MRTGLHGAALAALTSLSAVAAQAEWRCDCTTITDSCRGDVTIQGSWVEVSSDRQECSRVDYFIDGLPFVAVVVGGVQRQDWIARTEGSQVLVQSCQVCRDNAGADTERAPARTSTTPAEESGLTPIIKVVPQYPEAARAQGIEGRVEIGFSVNSSGAVVAPTVTSSSPAGVFDQAALAAISRWRYAPIADDAPARNASEVLAFTLEGNASRADARAPINVGGPRNECVREDAVYNYGDAVDVELINACAEPLLVYSCAAGTGRHADRWICASLEESARALVAPGDVRVGMPVNDTDAGRGPFELTDRYLITRAPNTQYWWVACGPRDAACRENARLWMRSLNQQSAGVDPQARSTLAIGRSY
jgi:TonB family protein